MKRKEIWVDFMMSFFIITACITILEGILGAIFLPDVQFGYEAFFSPPLFGLLSALLGFVGYSKHELTVRQAFFRKILHLSLIEIMVFGLNMLIGNIFEPKLCLALILAIAVVYITVNAVLWINDQKSAEKFNQELKSFQEKMILERQRQSAQD